MKAQLCAVTERWAVCSFHDIKTRFFQVDALLTNTEEFLDHLLPPHLFEYALKNRADRFWYKQAFEKGKNKENPIAVTFTNNWIFATQFELPGMLKWSEVVEQPPMLETSPIVTTVAMMQEKNWTYEMTWRKLMEDKNSVPLSDLERDLYGTIIPTVGGGVPKIEEAFLTPTDAENHPEDAELIAGLKMEIIKQVEIVDKLLYNHFEKMKTPELEPLSEALKEHHEITKERVDRLWRCNCGLATCVMCGDAKDEIYKVGWEGDRNLLTNKSFSSRNLSLTECS
jgi:hypothetical protein